MGRSIFLAELGTFRRDVVEGFYGCPLGQAAWLTSQQGVAGDTISGP